MTTFTMTHAPTKGGATLPFIDASSAAYGVPTDDGSRTNDATAALQAVLNAAKTSNKKTIWIPKMRLYLAGTNGVGLTAANAADIAAISGIRVIMDAETIIDAPNIAAAANGADAASPLYFSGFRVLSRTTVSGTLAKGAITITVADASAIAAGDFIVVRSADVFNPDRTQYTKGEWQQVKSKSGNVLTLWQPLRDDYATTIVIDHYIMLRNITLEGGRFLLGGVENGAPRTAAGGCLQQSGPRFQYIHGCHVLGTEVRQAERFGLYWYACVDTVNEQTFVKDSSESGMGYGNRITNCENHTSKSFRGQGNRHTTDTEQLSNSPVCRHIKFLSGSIRGDWGAALSTHGGTEFAEFASNNIDGCGGGIVSRGRSASIHHNKVYGSHNQGGESYYHPVTVGDGVGPNTPNVGAGISGTNLQVFDNEFDAMSNNGATIAHGMKVNAPLIDAFITCNIFRNFTGHGIHADGDTVRNAEIDSNLFETSRQISSSYDGIRIEPADTASGNNQQALRIRRNVFDGTLLGANVRVVGNSTSAAPSASVTIESNEHRSYGTSAVDIASGWFADVVARGDAPNGTRTSFLAVTAAQVSRLTTMPSTIANVVYGRTGLSDIARLHTLKAITYDPALAINSQSLTSGAPIYVKVPLDDLIAIANVHLLVAAAGATHTAFYAGVYNASGTQIGVSANVSASVPAANTEFVIPLSATVNAGGLPGDFVYVGILNAATTPVSLSRGSGVGGLINLGLTAAEGLRFGTSGTGLTALPASITITSLGVSGNSAFVGLS